MVKNGIQLTPNNSKYNKSLIDKNESDSIKIKLSFSFRFFKQIPFFEVGDCDTKWFISIIERIKELSDKESSFFIEGNKGGKTLRCHPIKWDAKNTPIKREDCNWISKEYLENEEDFTFYQFAVSTGKGRLIGFFNENHSIFYIVLFDPKHNLQPSKDFGYKVNKTNLGYSEYDNLKIIIEKINEEKRKCPHNCSLNIINDNNNVIYLDDDFYKIYTDCGYSIKDLVEEALLNHIDDK